MSDTIFHKIMRREIPADVVYLWPIRERVDVVTRPAPWPWWGWW